jgi:glycosyltransferase involved in cell wall biosynthesis
MYASMVKGKPVVVTCHDMLAVRGALGQKTDCPASFFGRFLQRWIVRGMRRAARVACISQYTFDDARRIVRSDRNLRIVLNGLNYPFQPLPPSEVDRRLAGLSEIQEPFILHIGANLVRKNREGVLRIFAKVQKETNLQLVFAGAALSADLIQLADELHVGNRIVQVVAPRVEIIEALYNRAIALLFPSRFEGFGWPPIEAQACGCPVVGSEIPPLIEVLGESAALSPLQDEAGMAESIAKLDREYREQMRQRGFENVHSRFQTSRMIGEYVSLYGELVCQR